MHRHYIYRSNELIATMTGECLIDMIDDIKNFISDDILSQKNFCDNPTVQIEKILESNEVSFSGVCHGESYTYTVKSIFCEIRN